MRAPGAPRCGRSGRSAVWRNARSKRSSSGDRWCTVNPRQGSITRLRKRIRALPRGIVPLFVIRPPNKPTSVFAGYLAARNGSFSVRRARVEFGWYPRPQVRFGGTPSSQPTPAIVGPTDIALGTPSSITGAKVIHAAFGSHPRVEGIANFLRIGQRRLVRSMRFHVANFHDYVGEPVRFNQSGHLTFSRSRLTLNAGDWVARLDQSPSFQQDQRTLTRYGGFLVGHAGEVVRRDGAPFWLHDASDFWSALHFFLTFARGNWCGPIIPVGIGSRGQLWSEWGSWRINDWQGVQSWFPRLDTTGVSKAWEGFYDLWSRGAWNEPLRELVHWYTEANLNSGALEGALVLSHTALELLSWMVIVNDRKKVSAKNFQEHYDSAARIRLALGTLRIPVQISSSLPEAAAFAARENAVDAPQLITLYRNSIVHPTPAKRARLARANHTTRFQILQLSQDLVELGLLALFRYQGKYVSRVSAGTTVADSTRTVPWV